jgi:hypothetical protein
MILVPVALIVSLVLILRHPVEHVIPPSPFVESDAVSSVSPAAPVTASPADTDGGSGSDAAAAAATESPSSAPRGEHERLHIALISHGWHTAPHYHDDTTIKGPTMSLRMCIAGILKYTTSPVSLYFVTGERDEPPIRELMRGVRFWRRRLEWRFVRLDEAQLERWMDAIGHRATHRTGQAGNVKFFYPLVFPRLDRLLMLDTDVLIDHDLTDLWMHFRHFEPRQLYAMTPQWASVHPTKDNQFNAGVMLLRLDRMRAAARPGGWLQLAKESIDNWHAKGMKPPCCTHGDQTVFHMIRFYRPTASLGRSPAAWIPRHWNINKCHGYQGVRDSGGGGGNSLPKHMPFVGLVHLGCCKKCTRAKIGPRWARLVDKLNGTDIVHAFSAQTDELAEPVTIADSILHY